MPVLYRKTAQLANEIRMAAADAILHTLRMVVSSSPKTSGKLNLTNAKLEVIEINPITTTVGSETGKDVVSIRTTISGSTENETEITAMYDQHVLNVKAAIGDGALKGFIPVVTFTAKP